MLPTILGLVALGVVALLVVIGVVARLVLHGMQAPLEARIADHYRHEDILLKDLGANCFGLESAGVWQVRGNGGLVLTGENLHFFMFLPKKEFCILLETITEVSIVRSHLGKTVLRDLLKVHFTAHGKPDSIAWYVADPHGWKDRIEAPGGRAKSAKGGFVPATIVSVRGAQDITVRLSNGDEVPAVLDAAALRERYGRIYGINLGGPVEIVLESPARIVCIEQRP